MEQLAELARRLNLILLSDEVYGTLRYKGTPQSMLAYAPERTVIISSASKEYLIPGARIGYVLSAEATFTNSWMSKMIRSFSSSPNVLGQQILIEILKLFPNHPYDMFVIDGDGLEGSTVRLAGYHLITNTLDEKTVIASFVWDLTDKYWFKVDDYGEHYVGTLLLPEEY